MLKTALLAVAFLCAAFAVSAAECEYPFDKTIGEFSAAGATVKIIPADQLPPIAEQAGKIAGKELGAVTRGFLVVAGGKVLLGLEVDGCLIPPIAVGVMNTKPTPALSGKAPNGDIGA